MTRAKRFVTEALNLLGEAGMPDDPAPVDDTSTDPDVIDDTAGPEDELDLGGTPDEPPVEDEFGLGASVAPTIRIEKDGPITINKGDVGLTIGDDGNIDITLDGNLSAAEPEDLGDMSDQPAEPEAASPEEDDYKIDWEKEKEEEVPEEGKKDDKGSKEPIQEGVSKALKVLSLGKVVTVTECVDQKYECMSCEKYDECTDKHKKAEPEDEKDFLTQGYM